MKRILVVKTSALGDITIALNILPHLKELAPYATIDWVCERPYRSLPESHAFIEKTICIDSKTWRQNLRAHFQAIRACIKELRSKRYDVVFDLQGNTKSALVTFFARGKMKIGFGKKSVAEWPNLLATYKRFNPLKQHVLADLLTLVYGYFNRPLPHDLAPKSVIFEAIEEERHLIQQLNFTEARPTLIVCPQSTWENKRLKHRVLSQFLSMIEDHYGCRLLIAWGTPIERGIAEKIAGEVGPLAMLLPKLSPPSLHAAMERAEGVISTDSFSLHLAALTTTPTFSIFGPSLGSYYAPKGPRHSYYQGPCPYHLSFEKRCAILRTCKSGSCIKQVDPAELFLAFKRSAIGRSLEAKSALKIQ